MGSPVEVAAGTATTGATAGCTGVCTGAAASLGAPGVATAPSVPGSSAATIDTSNEDTPTIATPSTRRSIAGTPARAILLGGDGTAAESSLLNNFVASEFFRCPLIPAEFPTMPFQKPMVCHSIPMLLLAALIAPACGGSTRTDASAADRPFWPWDVEPSPLPDSSSPDPDGAVVITITNNFTDDAPEATTVIPSADEDAASFDANDDLPNSDAAYICGDGYTCLANCENPCGLHDLGRSVCNCIAGQLHCSNCQIPQSLRPQIPTVVSATCGDDAASDVLCQQSGDACLLHPDWPYPDGCLCWPTDHGLTWGCAPVFDWFSVSPDAGG
jgi:hypothetical protein